MIIQIEISSRRLIRIRFPRNGNLTNNLQTTLNISTDDLVTNEVVANQGVPSMFNPMETFYLVLLNFVLAVFQTGLPMADMIYYIAVS